jgi:hypothetical protein
MASIVRDTQVIPGLRPRSDRALWKRIAAVLDGFRFSRSAGLKFPAASEASDQELQKLANRVNAGPTDLREQPDALVLMYGGGVIK